MKHHLTFFAEFKKKDFQFPKVHDHSAKALKEVQHEVEENETEERFKLFYELLSYDLFL